jgi:methyltransferase (TIGR00027 family)
MMPESVGSLGSVLTDYHAPARRPSHTALTAAAARAAHRIVDGEPRIFDDHLAEALLGDDAEELLSYHRSQGDHPVLAGSRAQVTCRARLTEQRVRASGVDQYIVLGAGLDSFAYRWPRPMRVFEVDHPGSQRWKRDRLAAAGLTPTTDVTYVPVDLEHGRLADAVHQHGFDAARPAVVSWLGVTMYLSRTAIDATLAQLAGLAAGSEIVLDYFVPAELRDERGHLYAELVGPVAAERGEPWLTTLTPVEAATLLAWHGWPDVVHIGQHDLPELVDRGDALRPSTLSMLAHGRR